MRGLCVFLRPLDRRFNKEVSCARRGFCLPTGDNPARRGVVRRERGVVRLERGVPVDGLRFLMGDVWSCGALFVLVLLAIIFAASSVSAMGRERGGVGEGKRCRMLVVWCSGAKVCKQQ